MLRLIVQYFAFKDDVAFLKVKQAYIHLPFWKAAFYTHVFSSIITLLAGFSQFSTYLLTNHKKWHRFFGRMYAWDILFINFPTGLVLAFYANGLWPSKLAFGILDGLWFWFTYKAVLAAKQKDFATHKRFMIRSFALTLSAITLRTWKIILSSAFLIDTQDLYMIDAWMGFVPNLLLAEWLIFTSRKRISLLF